MQKHASVRWSLRAVALVASAALASALLVAGAEASTNPGDGGCPMDLVTEKGTCAKRIPQQPLTAFQKDQRAGKASAVAGVRGVLSRSARSALLPKDPKPFSPAYVLPEMESMRLYKEGEGNGKKHYTCGPAATRNLIAALHKRKYGKYRDFGEHQFELWEGTTRAGTGRANIASALNSHFSKLGYWSTLRPANASGLLSWVIADTAMYGRAVIMNVETKYLPYFHRHPLAHFNLVYGYDTRGTTKHLQFAEEWDPKFVYGTVPTYGQTYGSHQVSLAAAFSAVNHDPIHGIVG